MKALAAAPVPPPLKTPCTKKAHKGGGGDRSNDYDRGSDRERDAGDRGRGRGNDSRGRGSGEESRGG